MARKHKKTQKCQNATTKRSIKFTNEIIEDHGDWLLVDISTPKFPDATMAVDTDVFNSHDGGRVYAWTGSSEKYIYAIYNNRSSAFCSKKFHKLVISECEGMYIDHIVHGTMSFIDNRKTNVRLVTASQNGMNKNKYSNNKSGMSGVFFNKEHKKWRSFIRIDGKEKHLGYFDNIEIAIGVRQQAEREYFGEFAYKGVE